MGALDWIAVALYFALVFAIAYWVTVRERKQDSSEDYFLAGRDAGWLVIAGSLFASNIGAEHLVGLAGTGAESGLAVGQFEILAALILLVLGWVFVPFYLRSGVVTMPEFLERRYSPAARWYLAVISIAAYVLTKISVTIYAGGVVFESLMGVSFWVGAITIVIATGVYTILGGLRAVLYTDLMQAVVLIGGALCVLFFGLHAVGGWSGLTASAGDGFMSVWKPISDPAFPWTGILLGAPILGVWYWCTDQFIVQRVLSAKNQDNARRGTIAAGLLKLLPLFLFVLPGVIAHSLVQSGELQLGSSDEALPALVSALLPAGVRGIVVAGLLAALMSSLSSVFNSCSTLITYDVYKKLRPEATERQLVWVGQVSTAVLVGLGLLWIPMMKNISGQVYQYLQSVQAYISPPIAAVFLIGIFWRRVNGVGALWALGVGFVIGAGRLCAELSRSHLTEGTLLYDFATMNFLHFAVLLFVVCVVVLIVASFSAPPPASEKLAGLTYATANEGKPAVFTAPPESAAWRGRDKLASMVLIFVVAALWVWFR